MTLTNRGRIIEGIFLGKYGLFDRVKWNRKNDTKVKVTVLVGEYTPKEHKKLKNSIVAHFLGCGMKDRR